MFNSDPLQQPIITYLRPEQVAEAKHVIYTVAHEVFHDRDTQEESVACYEAAWTLKDVEDFQRSYVKNGGTFLVTMDSGRIIGTGALRRLEDTVGEIKRLWLLPEYQGRGLGYRMMTRLLAFAREQGYTMVRLETSSSYQRRAYQFYRRLGFYDIPRFGDDPDDVAMELVLSKPPENF
jgi:ribosomal protein S18 acetylase RimI-like enzyme